MSTKKPKNTSWKPLARPTSKPRDVRDTVLMMFILNEIVSSGSPVTSVPRRTVQRCMFVAGGKRLSGHLKRLANEGWLTQIRSKQIGRGIEYGPGPLLRYDPALHFDWSNLSHQVFGPGGLFGEILDSSARSHGYLNNSGALCLAAISAADTPVQPQALKDYLGSIISPAGVTRSLKKLKELNLIVKDSEGYSVTNDWKATLKNYETECGSAERSSRIQSLTRAETIDFQKKQKLGIKRSSELNWRYLEPTSFASEVIAIGFDELLEVGW
jgi:hypothetical protein